MGALRLKLSWVEVRLGGWNPQKGGNSAALEVQADPALRMTGLRLTGRRPSAHKSAKPFFICFFPPPGFSMRQSASGLGCRPGNGVAVG